MSDNGSKGAPVDEASKYSLNVWGTLPDDFPTELAQRVYRAELDRLKHNAVLRRLMGMGFKGAAYRFRAASEYDETFSHLVSTHGTAPAGDVHYQQDKALFGFFLSGLAALESFAFALHAIGAHRASAEFAVDAGALGKITPKSVASAYTAVWPDTSMSRKLNELVGSEDYSRWKRIRNVLGHRAVPSRDHYVRPSAPMETIWAVDAAGTFDASEPLDYVTRPKREWLAFQLRLLFAALGAFDSEARVVDESAS